MAASCGPYFGTKVYSTNIKHGAYFTFLLYDADTARPLAQFEANHLGQIEPARRAAWPPTCLRPQDQLDVGIIGSGFQARTQMEALRAVAQTVTSQGLEPEPQSRAAFAERCDVNSAVG